MLVPKGNYFFWSLFYWSRGETETWWFSNSGLVLSIEERQCVLQYQLLIKYSVCFRCFRRCLRRTKGRYMCFTAVLPLWPKSSKLSVNTSASTSTRRTSEEVTGRQHTPAAVCVCVYRWCGGDINHFMCSHFVGPASFLGLWRKSMGLGWKWPIMRAASHDLQLKIILLYLKLALELPFNVE